MVNIMTFLALVSHVLPPNTEFSHKVRGPTVPKTLDIFQCGFTANDVCMFCMCFELIIHSFGTDFAP